MKEASGEEKARIGFGCVGALYSLFVVVPLWLFLTYKILSQIEADTATWTLYWVYLPSHWVGVLMWQVYKVIFGYSKD